MNLRIQAQGQPVDSVPDVKSGSTQPGGGSKSALTTGDAADTASLSTATSQLSGDVAIRQDRVDALRSQVESGTYTVDARAVATAMFQNLFQS